MRVLSIIGLLASLALPCLAQTPPAGMTPAQARSQYEALDPATNLALKQAAEPYKAQIVSDPALKTQIKAMLKSWLGK